MIKRYKIKNELSPPIMDLILNRRNITSNFRNLQELQSERKRTVFLWSRNFKLPYTPIMDTFARRN